MSDSLLDWMETGIAICRAGTLHVIHSNLMFRKCFPNYSNGGDITSRFTNVTAELVSKRLQKHGYFEAETLFCLYDDSPPTRFVVTFKTIEWRGETCWGLTFLDDRRLLEKDALLTQYTHTLERKQREGERVNLELEQQRLNVAQANQSLQTMLDSLNQGYFMFDREGTCQEITSQVCTKILGKNPAGRKLWDVLGIEDPLSCQRLKAWVGFLFNEDQDFEDLVALGPKVFLHTPQRYITLEYRLAKPASGTGAEYVVAIATDQSEVYEAKQQAEREYAYSNCILRIVKSRTRFLELIRESKVSFLRVREELRRDQPKWPVIGRLMHTFKGSVSYFSLFDLQAMAHQFESLLAQKPAENSQVHAQLLPQLQEMETWLGTFLSDHADLIGRQHEEHGRNVDVRLSELTEFGERLKALSGAEALADEFRERFTSEAIGPHFGFFDDVIAIEASRQGKEVLPLEVRNGALRVQMEPLRELMSSFVHIFRNAIAHGIENPHERHDAGKPTPGRVSVEFRRLPNSRLLSNIEDDGRGIDPNAIRQALRERGMGVEAEDEADQQVIQRIFLPGLSTATEVSDISGRGVGLDAVMTEVRKLWGQIQVSSTAGQGTQFRIEIPEIR